MRDGRWVSAVSADRKCQSIHCLHLFVVYMESVLQEIILKLLGTHFVAILYTFKISNTSHPVSFH